MKGNDNVAGQSENHGHGGRGNVEFVAAPCTFHSGHEVLINSLNGGQGAINERMGRIEVRMGNLETKVNKYFWMAIGAIGAWGPVMLILGLWFANNPSVASAVGAMSGIPMPTPGH